MNCLCERAALVSAALAAALVFPGAMAVKNVHYLISGGDFDPDKYAIQEKPISFTSVRKKLTLDYLRRHSAAGAGDIVIVPRIVVIHWTVNDNAGDARGYFDRETLQPDRADIRRGGALNVSAHYIVDRDGAIWRLMPDTWMARHVIGLNHCAIGIENIGGPAYPLTKEQLGANAWLVMYLARKYPTIEYVIGHHEYLEFRTGPLWRNLDPTYAPHRKEDPGETFMKDLRERLGIQ
jgi:N-acetylmuramoyl-L-alanine amidase